MEDRGLSNSSENRKYFIAEEKMSGQIKGKYCEQFSIFTCTLSGTNDKINLALMFIAEISKALLGKAEGSHPFSNPALMEAPL